MSYVKNGKVIVVKNTLESTPSILRLEPRDKGEEKTYNLDGTPVFLAQPVTGFTNEVGFGFIRTRLQHERSTLQFVPEDSVFENTNSEHPYLELYTGPLEVFIEEEDHAGYRTKLYPHFAEKGPAGETVWEAAHQGFKGEDIVLTNDQLPYIPLGEKDFTTSRVVIRDRKFSITMYDPKKHLLDPEMESMLEEFEETVSLSDRSIILLKESLKRLKDAKAEFEGLAVNGDAGRKVIAAWEAQAEDLGKVINEVKDHLLLLEPSSGVFIGTYELKEGDTIFFESTCPFKITKRVDFNVPGERLKYYAKPMDISSARGEWELTPQRIDRHLNSDFASTIIAVKHKDGRLVPIEEYIAK